MDGNIIQYEHKPLKFIPYNILVATIILTSPRSFIIVTPTPMFVALDTGYMARCRIHYMDTGELGLHSTSSLSRSRDDLGYSHQKYRY
jgi:hypothetical protein